MQTKSKVLLLSDSIRGTSGVGRMAHSIVHGTLDKFDWLHVAHEGQTKVNNLTKLDLSKSVQRSTGVPDAKLEVIPYHSFGDITLLRYLIHHENIDAIVIFQDPRYWEWLFEHEREIRQYVPIIFYNIWDNDPTPWYNRSFYESVDSLIAISKLTEKVNREILSKSTHKPRICRIPHGVNESEFYPITEFDPSYTEFLDFKKNLLGKHLGKYVMLFNSMNIDRKYPMGVIEMLDACKEFYPDLDICLVMHTDPIHKLGTDLYRYVDQHTKHKDLIVWSTDIYSDVEMNYLYNSADLTVSLSHSEGWGLSLTESVMAGTPIMATSTGGMLDQMFTETPTGQLSGSWATPLVNITRFMIGSHTTPYIYTDRVDIRTIPPMVKMLVNWGSDLQSEFGLNGRNWMIEQGMTSKVMATKIGEEIQATIKDFTIRDAFDIVKI